METLTSGGFRKSLPKKLNPPSAIRDPDSSADNQWWSFLPKEHLFSPATMTGACSYGPQTGPIPRLYLVRYTGLLMLDLRSMLPKLMSFPTMELIFFWGDSASDWS